MDAPSVRFSCHTDAPLARIETSASAKIVPRHVKRNVRAVVVTPMVCGSFDKCQPP